MTVDLIWGVSDMERNLEDGMVKKVAWRLDGFDGTYSDGAYGTIDLEPANPETMIPFGQLTEADVVQWVHAYFGSTKITKIENQIRSRINRQRTPVTGYGKPWDEASDTTED